MYKVNGLVLQADFCMAMFKTNNARTTKALSLIEFVKKYSDKKTSSELLQEDEEHQKINLTPSTTAKHRIIAPQHSYSKSYNPDEFTKEKLRGQRNKRINWKSNASENANSLLTWMNENRNKLENPSSKPADQEEFTNSGFHQGISSKAKPLPLNNWKNKSKPEGKRQEHQTIVQGEILFGQFPVLLALKTMTRKIHRLLMKQEKELSKEGHYAEIMSLARKNDIEVTFCSRQELKTLSHDRPHQCVCLDVSRLKPKPLEAADDNLLNVELTELRGQSPTMWLYLDAIQDPMNFGAILRTSCFMNVKKVFVSEYESCPLTPMVSKASSGGLEIMDIFSLRNKTAFFSLLKENGWDVIGTVGRNNLPNSVANKYIQLQNLTSISERTMLVLGNEGTGLSEEIQEQCTQLVSITPGDPDTLHTNLDSLNVSVATGIILHHMTSLQSSGSKKSTDSVIDDTQR